MGSQEIPEHTTLFYRWVALQPLSVAMGYHRDVDILRGFAEGRYEDLQEAKRAASRLKQLAERSEIGEMVNGFLQVARELECIERDWRNPS